MMQYFARDIVNMKFKCLVKLGNIHDISITCICKIGYHGKRCEFPNMCSGNSTAFNHCLSMNASCLPILDDYRCSCSATEYWLEEERKCKKIPYCYTDSDLIDNQCIYDLTVDYDLNYHQLFGCNEMFEFDINRCNRNQICNAKSCAHVKERCMATLLPKIPKSMITLCECEFDYGFVSDENGNCSLISSDQINNPFLKAILECPYQYTIEHSDKPVLLEQSLSTESFDHLEFVCTCPKNFELSSNGSTQLCTNSKECNLKCDKNRFCGFNEQDEATCLCDLGFYGTDCSNNFCENSDNHQIIKTFCGEYGCQVNSESESKFVCNCDERLYEVDSATGTCRMKEICGPHSNEVKICTKLNAICIPMIINSTLDFECVCLKGWQKDPLTDRCVELCDAHNYNELANQRCFANLTLNEPKFLCKPGFYRENKVCILSGMENKFELQFEARVNLNEDINSKLNEFKNDLPNITNIDCSKHLDKEGCIRMLNRTYLLLEERSNSLFMNQAFVYSFTSLLTMSLQSVLGNDLFSSQIVEFSKIDELDFVRRKAMNDDEVNLELDLFRTKRNSNTGEHINLPEQRLNSEDRQYGQLFNFTVYLETKGFFSEIDEHFFISNCTEKFCPLYPYLHIKQGTLNVRRLVLSETDRLTECYPNSSPIFELNSNSLFRCECDRGYRELARILLSSRSVYFKAICCDEDECVNDGHDCDLSTTTCLNLPGSFRCDCKDKLMMKVNETYCEDVRKSQQCNVQTTEFHKLIDGYECRCKNSSFIKFDEHNCYDPCATIDCKDRTCILHRNSTYCVDFKATNSCNSSSYSQLSYSFLVICSMIIFINLIPDH